MFKYERWNAVWVGIRGCARKNSIFKFNERERHGKMIWTFIRSIDEKSGGLIVLFLSRSVGWSYFIAKCGKPVLIKMVVGTPNAAFKTFSCVPKFRFVSRRIKWRAKFLPRLALSGLKSFLCFSTFAWYTINYAMT